MAEIIVQLADFTRPRDGNALQSLMQEYAMDPMGGGQALNDELLVQLPRKLAAFPGACSVLAWQGDQPVGLINTFETLSTFKGRPLINIHDVVVTASCRGQGVARQMLDLVEQVARERDCCKLTLEVLQGNARAQQVYLDFGFAGYELDEQFGKALFWEKPLVNLPEPAAQ